MYIFAALYLLVWNRTWLGSGFEPDPKLISDPDPNLQIISEPAGSTTRTLVYMSENNLYPGRGPLVGTKGESRDKNK